MRQKNPTSKGAMIRPTIFCSSGSRLVYKRVSFRAAKQAGLTVIAVRKTGFKAKL